MNLAHKVAPPRPLTHVETHDSLTQFRFRFNNFYRKDVEFRPMLRSAFTWNGTQNNYGRTPDEGDDLETLLGNICSLLPFPYLNNRILKESRSWADVWDIIFEHYQAKPNQGSNLDFVSLTIDKKNGESYLTFFERLCHHQRTHLAPTGAVGTGQPIVVNDILTVSHTNLIAMFWMQGIDLRLPKRVAVEYATELQACNQITSLVPQIAKRADSILMKTQSQATKSTPIQSVEATEIDSSAVAAMINKFSSFNKRPDGNQRREQRSQNYPQRNSSNQSQRSNFNNQAHCPGCKYLGDQLKLQVKFNHFPSDCPRKGAVVNMLKGEDMEELEAAEDVNDFISEVNKDTDAYKVFQSTEINRDEILKCYQRSYIQHIYSLSNDNELVTEEEFPNEIIANDHLNYSHWVEEIVSKINRLESNAVRKEKSPSLLVKVDNTNAEATIDEGAELNCLDEEFCLKSRIDFTKTDETATAAGQQRMALSGQTVKDVILIPNDNTDVQWNLGKCVVVRNLGSSILVGEPGKKDNKIVTIPHSYTIII
jgi:hypothetical protein